MRLFYPKASRALYLILYPAANRMDKSLSFWARFWAYTSNGFGALSTHPDNVSHFSIQCIFRPRLSFDFFPFFFHLAVLLSYRRNTGCDWLLLITQPSKTYRCNTDARNRNLAIFCCCRRLFSAFSIRYSHRKL